MLFTGCIHRSKAYLKVVNDPNSDYNKYRLGRYPMVNNNMSYEDYFNINSLNLINNGVEIDISYQQNGRHKISAYKYVSGPSNPSPYYGRVNILNEVKLYRRYPLDKKHLEVDIYAQNNKCSYAKIDLKRKILSKYKIRFNIPQKYKNRYIKFIFKTKGLKKNKEIKKCINCNKFC
jgi:hypothetical protein